MGAQTVAAIGISLPLIRRRRLRRSPACAPLTSLRTRANATAHASNSLLSTTLRTSVRRTPLPVFQAIRAPALVHSAVSRSGNAIAEAMALRRFTPKADRARDAEVPPNTARRPCVHVVRLALQPSLRLPLAERSALPPAVSSPPTVSATVERSVHGREHLAAKLSCAALAFPRTDSSIDALKPSDGSGTTSHFISGAANADAQAPLGLTVGNSAVYSSQCNRARYPRALTPSGAILLTPDAPMVDFPLVPAFA